MNQNSSTDNLLPVLSAEIIIRGILTLGERLAKIILAGIQKGLDNLVKAGMIPSHVAKEFRQLKAKILGNRNEETAMNPENGMIRIEDIGRMMFECGWRVHLLVNDGCYPEIGSKEKKLAAAGYKQVGNDKFHLSIIAGKHAGYPRGPADEYEEVELLMSIVGQKISRNSCAGKEELEKILRDPTVFCPTTAEFYKERRARKKQHKKIAA